MKYTLWDDNLPDWFVLMINYAVFLYADSNTMITEVYHAEGYVSSWVDHERNLMVVKTFNLNLGPHAKIMFGLNIEALEKYKPQNIILDKSAAIGMQNPTDEAAWLRNTLFPEYRKRGLRKVINIFPKNPIARFGTKNWLDIGKEFGFDFIEFPSLDEAYNYLNQNEPKTGD